MTRHRSAQFYALFNAAYVIAGVISWFIVGPVWPVLAVWLFVALGNGAVGHRYFGHAQYSVSRPMRWILAAWCTVSGYGTPLYWAVQHRHHHRHSDGPADLHSPRNGVWMSLFGWPFSPRRLNSIWRDRATRVAHAHFSRDSALALFGSPQGYILTNLVFLTVLALVNPVLPALMAMSLVIEHCRIAFVNACCHIPGFPGNYRNHDTQDQSHNNWILGALTLGFAFHNNHHAHPNQVVLQERWWEWDLEGLVARLLSRM